MTTQATAAARRKEIFAAIEGAESAADAVRAVSHLLSIPEDEARRVLSAPLTSFIEGGESTTAEPAGEPGVRLRPFTKDDADDELYAQAASDRAVTGADAAFPSESVAGELRDGRFRIEQEDAAWFVVVEDGTPVGMVFGELVGGDVTVSVWVAEPHRRRGLGMGSLRAARRELAAYFPGATLVVRTPGLR